MFRIAKNLCIFMSLNNETYKQKKKNCQLKKQTIGVKENKHRYMLKML